MRFLKFDSNTATHTYPDNHRPRLQRWLRNRHHRAIRHMTRRLIDEQLEDLNPDLPPPPPSTLARMVHGSWHPCDAKPRNLLEEVYKLMERNGLDEAEVRYVNHSVGSMTWPEFELAAGEVTYYTGCYTIYGLDDSFAVVGNNWYIGLVSLGDETVLGCMVAPKQIPYHQKPSPRLFAEHGPLYVAA